jgi:hypothetical protein
MVKEEQNMSTFDNPHYPDADLSKTHERLITEAFKALAEYLQTLGHTVKLVYQEFHGEVSRTPSLEIDGEIPYGFDINPEDSATDYLGKRKLVLRALVAIDGYGQNPRSIPSNLKGEFNIPKLGDRIHIALETERLRIEAEKKADKCLKASKAIVDRLEPLATIKSCVGIYSCSSSPDKVRVSVDRLTLTEDDARSLIEFLTEMNPKNY